MLEKVKSQNYRLITSNKSCVEIAEEDLNTLNYIYSVSSHEDQYNLPVVFKDKEKV